MMEQWNSMFHRVLHSGTYVALENWERKSLLTINVSAAIKREFDNLTPQMSTKKSANKVDGSG
eukprot:12929151-Prorocentrum_lima.AAC.1